MMWRIIFKRRSQNSKWYVLAWGGAQHPGLVILTDRSNKMKIFQITENESSDNDSDFIDGVEL